MPKTNCAMAYYQCLNDSCENYNVPVAIQCENETAICPICGATMMRENVIKSEKGGDK